VKMLERFSMENAKPVSTPLANHLCLSTSQCPKTVEETEDMSKVLYASAVGCLMYTTVCTRPDLAQAVSVVSKYMANLRIALGCGQMDFQILERYYRL
jgi:hypothetical protein